MTASRLFSKHKRSVVMSLFSFAILFLCSCGGGSSSTEGQSGNNNTGVPNTDFSVPAAYSGTMATKIDYIDSATGTILATQNYSSDAVIKLDSPVSITSGNATLVKENNPFNLQIWTLPFGETVAEYAAKAYICSAVTSSLTTVPNTSPNTLLQFWTLSVNGNNLAGEVTDAHSGNFMKPFANFIDFEPARYVVYTGPLRGSVANGTKISGTITSSQVQLVIDGNLVEVTGAFGGYYCRVHCEVRGNLQK